MSIAYPTDVKSVLQALIENLGISEAELARRMQIPTATLNKIKTGVIADPRSSTLTLIANYFGITIDQLLGNAPIERIFPRNLCYVPVIDPCDILITDCDGLNKSNHEKWISFEGVPSIITHKMFATKVQGNAMWPRFDDETIVIVDCDQPVESKQYIVIHIEKDDQIILRQIFIDGSDYILKPISHLFPVKTLEPQDKIIGVVIHYIRCFL